MSQRVEAVATGRLGLLHLVAWVCACAVQATIIRHLTSLIASDKQFGLAMSLSLIGWTLAGGTALAGLLLFAKRRLTKQRFPVDPGEWLWMVLGVQCVLGNLLLAVQLFRPFWPHLVIAARYGTTSLVLFLAWWHCREFGRWGLGLMLLAVPFALSTILSLLDFVGSLSFTFATGLRWVIVPSPAVFLIQGIVVASLAIDDLVHRRQRAWSHWVGVILWLWRIMGFVIGYFAF